MQVESNAPGALHLAEQTWGARRQLFQAAPLRLTIHVQKNGPPAAEPAYQATADGFSLVCDPVTRARFSIREQAACLHISRAVLEQTEWFRHQLLECLVLSALDTIYFVGLHAACVVPPHRRGVLLCGESGSGKSTLAYACARNGWTFVSDDTHLAPGDANLVTGNSHGIRLREPARELFPELRGRPSITAPNGKRCIEVALAGTAAVSDTASARHCVFLSRRPGPAALHAHAAEDAVEYFMEYNPRHDRAGAQRRLNQFVRGGTWLMEYQRLEDAIEILEKLP